LGIEIIPRNSSPRFLVREKCAAIWAAKWMAKKKAYKKTKNPQWTAKWAAKNV